MTDYAAQLRAIRRTLAAHEIHLCRWGDRAEWVALGLAPAPTLRYSQGCWVGSNERLQQLIDQALGDSSHDHRHQDQATHLQPRRLDRSHQARPRQRRA